MYSSQAPTIVDHLTVRPLSGNKFLDDSLQILEKDQFFQKSNVGRVENLQQNRCAEATANSLKNELDLQESRLGRKRPISSVEETSADSNEPQPPAKVWKGLRYKTWNSCAMQPPVKYKKQNEREVTEVCLISGLQVCIRKL